MSDIVEVMRRARDRWLRAPTTGKYARDSAGNETNPRGEDAVCWCAFGALIVESDGDSELEDEALFALGVIVRETGAGSFTVDANDAGTLTREHWDAAIRGFGGTP